jgi:hypothetical protein
VTKRNHIVALVRMLPQPELATTITHVYIFAQMCLRRQFWLRHRRFHVCGKPMTLFPQNALGDTCALGAGTGFLASSLLGGLADVERDLIRTRTGEGRTRAKAREQHVGRPSQKQEARRRRKDGESVADLARSYGVSPAAIYRTTEAM